MEYVQMTLDDWMEMKKKLRAELLGVKQSFVRIGYALRKIEEQKLYEQDGYKSIAEFAKSEYGLEPSTVSRFMSINREYSVDGYSEILRPEYADLRRSQLEEMLKLPDADRQMIQPETSRDDIRELKRFNKADPEPGVADDIEQLISNFYRDNPEIQNAIRESGIMQENIKDLIEIVNPSGNRSYKKGLFFLMMYEDCVKIKKFGENPQTMDWKRFFEITEKVEKELRVEPQKEPKEIVPAQLENIENTKCEEDLRPEEKLGQEETKELDKKSEEDSTVIPEKKIAPAQLPENLENTKHETDPKKPETNPMEEDNREIPGQMELTKDMPEYCPDEVILNEPEPEDTELGQQASISQKPAQEEKEEVTSHYGSRKKYLDSLTEYRAALYMAASIREMPHMLLNDPDYWNQWLSQEVDNHGEAIELVE